MPSTEEIFMEFWDYVEGDEKSGRAAYAWIKNCYEQYQRWYHDWSHVEEMVQRLYAKFTKGQMLARGYAYEGWAVIYAAFMHDVYTPGSPGDVEASAKIASSVLTTANFITVPHWFHSYVELAVMATKDHKATDPYIQSLTDADLARFSVGDWRDWEMEIRYEYGHVPEEQYNLGRRAILEHFAARTPFYYHSWEDLSDEAAYENIRQQIADTYPKEEKVPNALDELQELKAAYDAAVKDKGQEIVDAIFKTAFDEVPEIQSITWTQGTPGFNDGDPCVFSVHEPSILFDAAGADAFGIPEDKRADEEGDDEDDYGNQIPAGGYSFDGYGLYDSYEWEGEHPNRVKVWKNERHQALSELHDRLSGSMQVAEDMLASVFDGDARVTVTRDGYDVDEYYDY